MSREKEQIARFQILSTDLFPFFTLTLTVTRSFYSMKVKDNLNQTAAIEPQWRNTAPQVRDAEESRRGGDDFLTRNRWPSLLPFRLQAPGAYGSSYIAIWNFKVNLAIMRSDEEFGPEEKPKRICRQPGTASNQNDF